MQAHKGPQTPQAYRILGFEDAGKGGAGTTKRPGRRVAEGRSST